jgi:hypothetical protein
MNSDIKISKEFVAEAVEYAINPFQLNNTDNIANNIFEVNLYNFSNSVNGIYIDKIEVQNLTTPIEFSFPISDNVNLTEFMDTYNLLTPF